MELPILMLQTAAEALPTILILGFVGCFGYVAGVHNQRKRTLEAIKRSRRAQREGELLAEQQED